MAILKVKMTVTQNEDCTHYDYPPEYDARKIQVLVYGGTGETEYCLGVVKDVDAPAFLQSPDIVKITRDEALVFGNKYTEQVEKITNSDAVLKVCAKAALGTALSAKDKKVLDPSDATPGINLSKSFEEGLDETLSSL